MKPYPYLAVVAPEAPAGALVYQLQAQDGDEAESGEVEYFLSDGNHTHKRTQKMHKRKEGLKQVVLLLKYVDRQ